MERNSNINNLPPQSLQSAPGMGRPAADVSPQMGERLRVWAFDCLSKWPWFIVSVLICMAAGYIYVIRTPKTYSASVSLLINTEQDSKERDKDLKELGVDQATSNIANELVALKTSDVGLKIVDILGLDVDYYHEGRIHEEVSYGTQLPVLVHFDDLKDSDNASLAIDIKNDSTVILNRMVLNGTPVKGAYKTRLGSTAKTPLGNITILPGLGYRPNMIDHLKIYRNPKAAVAASIVGRVSADLRSKNSTVVDIRFSDTSRERAVDVLQALVEVYNDNWVQERERVTDLTNKFIRERLGVIEDELGMVDQDISSYKSANLLPDIQQAGSLAMSQAAEAGAQSRAIAAQIQAARAMRSSLLNASSNPVAINSSVNNSMLAQQVQQYNEGLLKRDRAVALSSDNNPMVQDIDSELAHLRAMMVQTLDNEIVALQSQQAAIAAGQSIANAQIAVNPMQEQHLLTVERQQKVKESLYLFLLQKREENELTQAFTNFETKIVEKPHPVGLPFPDRNSILAISFLVGLLIPASILLGKEMLSSKVRSRSDFERLKVPFAGEIPLEGEIENATPARRLKRMFGGRRDKRGVERPLMVTQGAHDSLNEAFRVFRTNVEYIVGFNSPRKVVMLTSINPGSGKTFITRNLAETIGIGGKKVIAIDLDMRKRSLSKSVGDHERGVSAYLSGETDDLDSLIHASGSFDVLPCGKMPPNPTELLLSPRMKTMIDTLAERYDYVLIDCSPVEIVADVPIIGRHADATLFVARAGILDRSYLKDVEQWYEEGKYPNMAVVLNGTSFRFAGYGNRHYGYRYAYGYYGYGYGEKTGSRRSRRK